MPSFEGLYLKAFTSMNSFDLYNNPEEKAERNDGTPAGDGKVWLREVT